MSSTQTPPQTLLSLLRTRTSVDCDTLDASVAESLGPFQDCTSNQAIAYAELQHRHHEGLIARSAASARELGSRFPGVTLEALAVEICMINLSLLILPHLKGRMHIQVNPLDAYSTPRTVTSARRIISLFEIVSPGLPAKNRVAIKIPSTWEGLQACRILERDHEITTLATTLFSLEQAAVAGEAACGYIAPYLNELAVHFEEGFIDPFPNHHIPLQCQTYLAKHNYTRTATLPASLISTDECMAQSGVDHITISPPLLRLLQSTIPSPSNPVPPSLFDDQKAISEAERNVPDEKLDLIDDEERFRMLFTRRDGGRQEVKQVKAINVFIGMQGGLEGIVRGYLGR